MKIVFANYNLCEKPLTLKYCQAQNVDIQYSHVEMFRIYLDFLTNSTPSV